MLVSMYHLKDLVHCVDLYHKTDVGTGHALAMFRAAHSHVYIRGSRK